MNKHNSDLISVQLSPKLVKALDAEASSLKISRGALIKDILEEYVQRHSHKQPDETGGCYEQH